MMIDDDDDADDDDDDYDGADDDDDGDGDAGDDDDDDDDDDAGAEKKEFGFSCNDYRNVWCQHRGQFENRFRCTAEENKFGNNGDAICFVCRHVYSRA